jgi:hypothetical protein
MAKKCTSDKDLYEDVEFCQGSASLPGVRPHMYVTRRVNILTFPKVKGDNATKLEDVAVLDGNFVLAEGCKWVKIDLVEGESEPTCESQGNEGAKSFLNKIAAVLPGTQKKVTGLVSKMNNDDIVILYPQRDGAIRVIGNEMFRVQVELGQNAGKSVTDSSQTTITASVSDINPAPFYEGDFETADGTIDGKTDTIKSE